MEAMLSRRALRETPVITVNKDLRLPRKMNELAQIGNEWPGARLLNVDEVEETEMDEDKVL